MTLHCVHACCSPQRHEIFHVGRRVTTIVDSRQRSPWRPVCGVRDCGSLRGITGLQVFGALSALSVVRKLGFTVALSLAGSASEPLHVGT